MLLARMGSLLLLLMAMPPVASEQPVRIAIIIDDLGNDYYLSNQALQLPGNLTFAILPQLPLSTPLSERARQLGKEVMLHLPMQTTHIRTLGPGGLTMELTRTQFEDVIRKNLASVPDAVGINNHMGSLLTQHPGAMDWLMGTMKSAGNLFFVDSRTNVGTVAQQSAQQAGLANSRRDVFLDNEQTPEYIHAQLQQLVRLARRHGSAIGIGHPYPVTIETLKKELPKLAAQGVIIEPVSNLIAYQRSLKSWPESSYPLPKVAKNLKQ